MDVPRKGRGRARRPSTARAGRHLPRTLLALAVLTLGAGGCKSVTSPVEMDEFRWSPMPNPETLVARVEATSALSILYIQGWLPTPSPCFDLSGDFEKKGNDLILRVSAKPDAGTGCDSGVGGFEYTAVITDLARKTYDLKVVHTVQGGQGGEYNLSVTVQR